MFSYMVGFAEICSQASAMKIVECINNVFTMFDNIIDQYDVFKVTTDYWGLPKGLREKGKNKIFLKHSYNQLKALLI